MFSLLNIANKNNIFSFSKNIIYILFFLFVLICLLFSFLFSNYKEQRLLENKNEYFLIVNNLHNELQENLLNNDYVEFNSDVYKAFKSNFFSKIQINYDEFIFNKHSLIKNVKFFDDDLWTIGDITVDASFGYILKIPKTNAYRFIEADTTQEVQRIQVKIQVYNAFEIKYFFTPLVFRDIIKIHDFPISNSFYEYFENLIDYKNETLVKVLLINKSYFGKITYHIDQRMIKQEIIELFLIYIFLIFIFILLPFFFIAYYHYNVSHRFIKEPIYYLNEYLDSLLKSDFTLIKKEKALGIYGITNFTNKISKITSKLASLQNEVNMNKENIERKISIDTLTGLANESLFNFDMKNKLINNEDGILLSLQIECLVSLSKKIDYDSVNNFINVYVGLIKNVIAKYSHNNIILYRLFGSSFSIVCSKTSLEDSIKMSNEIIKVLEKNIPNMFNTNEKVITIGGTYFDGFGTIQSTLKSSKEALLHAKEMGSSICHIIEKDLILKATQVLTEEVISIVKKENFSVSFSFDTHLIGDRKNIIMREISPLLYDEYKNKIAIGSFLSIASSIKMVHLFDEIIIKKAMSYIEENDSKYCIVVNISFDSLVYSEFLEWLMKTLQANTKIAKKIIFTVTSYSAYMNQSLLKMFIEEIHSCGSKILIKRYQLNDFPINELKDLNIDYIRLHQNTSINISNDKSKKYILRNTIAFANLHDINIIADSVYLEQDYKILSALGTYAICE